MSDATAPVVRADRILPGILGALVAAVAAWAARPYAVGVFHDDGVYVILGKALATGQGYRFLHLPGAPAATHYPPAYPLLLALLWKAAPSFPANVQTFLFANAVLLGITALGVDRFAHRVLGWPRYPAALAAVVATLSTPLLMLSSLVLSEPLFAAALFPVLIAAERVVKDDVSVRRVLLVSVALGVLALVRTHALALTLASICVMIRRRRWRSAAVCAAGVCATLAPWQLWLALHSGSATGSLAGSYGTYSAWLTHGALGGGMSFVLRTIALNAREVVALIADHFALGDGVVARDTAAALVLVLMTIGAWRAAKRAPVLVAFAVIYSLVLLVWPFTPWRFVYAVWPLAILFVGETVALVAERRAVVTHVAPRALVAALAIIVTVGAVREEARAYGQRAWRRPGAEAATQIAPLVKWVAAKTNADDVVAVDGEQLIYLFTGRRALPVAPFTAAEYVYPRTPSQNAESLRGLISQFPVRYVATISPSLRASGEMVSLDSLPTAGPSGAVKLVRLGTLAAGEVFRVDRAER